jgi:transcriptional regulator of heat shock response
MSETPDHFLEEKSSMSIGNDIVKLSDFVHKITYELAKNTREIAFFLIPEKHISEHSGVATFLRKNHKRIGDDIYNIIKMLEDKVNFSSFIQGFPIHEGVNIFIGEENILPYLKDYTIILKPLSIEGQK